MVRNIDAKRLSFTCSLTEALKNSDAVFIAVGTPTRDDGSADLSSVFDAAEGIALAAQDNIVVILKSTVPVGTNRQVLNAIQSVNQDLRFDIASNPEFLREGVAIGDFMRPDRIVVGVRNESTAKVMKDIYRPLCYNHKNFLVTDLESAEMIKYISNAMLAAKVSFINEVAALCEKTGADVCEVSRGVGLDSRIGEAFLNAGPGYGGSCFPKDTAALAFMGREHRSPMTIVEAVISANQFNKIRMVEKLRVLSGGSFSGQRIAIFGVTFKPDTDDMRMAPSLDILASLVSDGASVVVVDPQGRREGEALLPSAEWMSDPYEAAKDADLVVLITEWNEFCALDLVRIASLMRVPRMADLRNIYTAKIADKAGFYSYQSVGRASFNKYCSISGSFSPKRKDKELPFPKRKLYATRNFDVNEQSL
jgi:UDPglucose 6-dehydrogenase